MDIVREEGGDGKPTGSLLRLKGCNSWRVQFSDPPLTQCFSDRRYGGEQSSHFAAELFQWAISVERGTIRNQWRICTGPEGEVWGELSLNDGVAIFDLVDLNLVEDHVWCSWKSGRNVYVVESHTQARFHRQIHPEWPMVDHRNRDGLDNRRANLRDGSLPATPQSGSINTNNCRVPANNTSGVVGVHYDSHRKGWVATWRVDKIPKKREFPGPNDQTHPSFHAACEWRAARAAEVGNTNGQDPGQ